MTTELAVRKECFLPPHCHLAFIGFSSANRKLVGDWATMYATSLRKVGELTVGEAAPCALEKAEGRYRWQVVLRAVSAASITKAWRWISSVRPAPKGLRITLDVDAFNLI